jgi:hypothetical protein
VNALERRYRRLMWLLPAAQRRARGEELVGVLTDVDAGRSWPSPAEAWALLLMALRLRAARARPALVLALTALLVAESTRGAGHLLDLYTGGAYAHSADLYRDTLLLDTSLVAVTLVAPVAWILGAIRVAAVAYGVVYLTSAGLTGVWIGANGMQVPAHMVVALLLPTVIMTLLGAAWRGRWAPPRPRVMWLLLLAACAAGWTGVAVLSRPGQPHTHLDDVLAVAGVVVLCAVAFAYLARRRPWPVTVAAGLAGAGVGYLLATRLAVATWFWFAPHHGDPVPFAIVLFVVAAAVRGVSRVTFPRAQVNFRLHAGSHDRPDVAAAPPDR